MTDRPRIVVPPDTTCVGVWVTACSGEEAEVRGGRIRWRAGSPCAGW